MVLLVYNVNDPSGHGSLNKHLQTIGITNDPLFEKCGELEFSEHFLSVPSIHHVQGRHLGAYVVTYNSILVLVPFHGKSDASVANSLK